MSEPTAPASSPAASDLAGGVDPNEVNGDVTTTWRALWNETSDVLGDRQHARWLCETASSTESDEFLEALDDVPMVRMVSHLDAMVARYRTGEPLQYVLGRWAFRRLDLAIDQRVLIPRPETEMVAEVALTVARRVDGERTVIDLGTGSGAIGLALADELPLNGTTVWLTDASADALDVARANLAGIGRAAQNVQIAHGSWFDALPTETLADVIVSNPPYVAVGSPDLESIVSDWEPTSALLAGPDGLDDLRVIIGGATGWLRPGGWLILEIGSDQGNAVRSLLDRSGFINIDIEADFASHDRIAVAQRPEPE
jgi:release factor glutamine methyltransferase